MAGRGVLVYRYNPAQYFGCSQVREISVSSAGAEYKAGPQGSGYGPVPFPVRFLRVKGGEAS